MKKYLRLFLYVLALALITAFSACSNNGADDAVAPETDNFSGPTPSAAVLPEPSEPTPSPYFLSLDEINEKYKDFNILSTTEVGDHFVLIEWQADSHSANRFDLYNQKTGEVDQMPTYAQYVTLKEAVSENYLIFEDSGKNSESIISSFPQIMKCVRAYIDNPKNGNFIAIYEAEFFELDRSVEAGSRTGITLSAINVTFDGIEVMFMPNGSDNGYFYTPVADIPPTKTSYNSGEFTIEIETGRIDERLTCGIDITTDFNQYFSKYRITQDGDKTYIVLSLRETAKEYSIQKARVPADNKTVDGYPYFIVQFTG